MNLGELKEFGEELIKEEGRLLIKVANGEASEREIDRYRMVHGLVDEIEARLERSRIR